ncbi:L,D-transpeptidase family protein [Sphingomonas sp. LHG3406-1]|uniref:L,D-transpeptidase family protein n=1 Tax=Sphingomonas sp. LHG3406-1 TaxID=2804617 RepID=UPI002613F5F3|nr:L,D-transpeptidase family protein [Sphingomonas sp. LHG3406-1]
MQQKLLLPLLLASLAAGCATAPSPRPAKPAAPAKWSMGHSDRAAVAEARVFGGTLPLKSGEWKWNPAAPRTGAAELVVNLGRQRAWLYRGGELAAVTTVSSGKPGKDSPVGRFPILEKKRFHRSNRYSNAPMPFMQRMNPWGVALHGGEIPPYPASHGCIRLPMKFAERLYAVTAVGTPVWVED